MLDKKLSFTHGGYRQLAAYKGAEIVYDLTEIFCQRYIEGGRRNRTYDQMVQAARSGKQNIAEGSMASGTSKKTELKLVSVARASLEELLLDYEDNLRQKKLSKWDKDDPRAKDMRQLSYLTHKDYKTYLPYMTNEERASNCMVCLINQTNYLLDRLSKRLEEDFLKHGGFTERLYQARKRW